MDRFHSLDVQFGLAHDCLRSFIFAGHISSVKNKADGWHSIADMCYADGVISWNMIFGSKSQNTHWRTFNDAFPPPPESGLLPFSKEVVLKTVGFDESGWSNYHRSLVNFRNTRLAHLSHLGVQNPTPDIQPAYSSMFIYRDWLLFLAKSYRAAGHNINPTTELASQVAETFRRQISEIL